MHAKRTNPAEGHVRRARVLELGRGTGAISRSHRPRASGGRGPRSELRRFCRPTRDHGSSRSPSTRAIVSRSSACSSSASGEPNSPEFRFARLRRPPLLRGPVLAELRLFLSTDLPHVRRPPEPDDFLLYPTKKVYDGRGPEGQQMLAVRAYPKKRPSPQAVHRGGTANCRTRASSVAESRTASTCTLPATRSPPNPVAVAGIDAASQALHRDQTDLEVAMEAYAKWLEQQLENEIVPPEADR